MRFERAFTTKRTRGPVDRHTHQNVRVVALNPKIDRTEKAVGKRACAIAKAQAFQILHRKKAPFRKKDHFKVVTYCRSRELDLDDAAEAKAPGCKYFYSA